MKNKQGRSNYHNSLIDEFTFYILGEVYDSDFKEICYSCRLLKKYQNKFAMKDELFNLRKSLFRENGLYIFLSDNQRESDEEIYEQLNLFDFIEG